MSLMYIGGGEKALRNPFDMALYIVFFPQLIAGPIIRFKDFYKELLTRESKMEDMVEGMKRFTIGLCKKVLIANTIGELSDTVFGIEEYAGASVGFLWLGAIAYTIQIYYDFSGYSDMAIGLARIFGFHYKENFNYPYAASSITDFWRRWHISLSGWFRDYVFIPLGGSRCSKARTVRNLLVVWLLTGIWHGANWTFLLWGLSYFIFLVLEKMVIHPEKIKNKLLQIFYRVLIIIIVVLLWVIFRANSVERAMEYIVGMFGAYGQQLLGEDIAFNISSYYVPLLAGMGLSVPWFSISQVKRNPRLYGSFVLIQNLILVILFFVVTAYLLMGSYNPFLYYIF